VIGGWPDATTLTHRGAIEIPGAISLLLHGDPTASIRGLDAVPLANRPPVTVVHLAFQIMVGCGMVLAAVALWTLWRLRRRRRGYGAPLPDDRPFLTALVVASPLGFVALEAGWTVTEVGRQPWIMQDVLRTADAVTPVPGLTVPFVGFTLLYIGLAVTVAFLLWRQLLKTGVGEVPVGMTGELPVPAALLAMGTVPVSPAVSDRP
jgi:cytochrome d ubiquinol oxidase subunit I